MISFLIKYKKSILITTLVIFIGSIAYLGLDTYSRTNYTLTAAKVGKITISTRDLDRATQKVAQEKRNAGSDFDEESIKALRQEVLQALIGQELINQAAQQAGLHTSDYEVAATVSVPFSANGRFDKRIYTTWLRKEGITPADFEDQIRRASMSNNFMRLLISHYKTTPKEAEQLYQVQHGNLDKFEDDKQDFMTQLTELKMGSAMRAFQDQFNNNVEIKTFLKD